MTQNKNKNFKTSITKRIKAEWKEFLEENLPKLIRFFINYLRKIKGLNDFENPDNLEDFSPVILTDEEDKHCKTIKFAIDNRNIQNLALTGPNGSGKSSILRTFEHKYPEFKCLNISLATFDKKTLETDKIEYNILKQLFYSVEHKKIPESRFKRIENHTGIWWKTLLFVLWLFSIIYFIKIEPIENIKKSLYVDYHIKGFDIIYGLYFIAGTFFILNKIMNFIINFKLTKFKIKETDFETNQDKKTINFENEIDEILYFFERNPIEIVFIQDIDRFKKNKSEIFIKLREINNLLNNYEPIKKYRKVTFIYAVTDDVFKENERSKFFDFIIPVIPIINYTNSSSFIIEKLNDEIKTDLLSKEFIEDVSLFLNDYRTIKSIYNEYIIYKKILGKNLLNYNNLFAMMIYKNIEPTDFENLNKNKGYVFKAVENSNELIKTKIDKYENKIDELNKKIEDVENEKLKNEKELKMIYILKFFELAKIPTNQGFYGFNLENTKCSIEDVLTDKFFDLFKKESSIKYYYNSYNITSSGISFNKIENSIDAIGYSKRLELINSSKKNKLNQIKVELADNENKKREVNSKKLFELLDEKNSTSYFQNLSTENEEINNLKLIKYLLSNGFINEDYNHYISYFHPGSITKEDNDFLISLLSTEKALQYNHKLYEIASLLKKIKPQNYNQEAILNFSLIDYLVENKIDDKLNLIISLLIKKNEKSIPFIDEYLNETNEINKVAFYKIIFNKWNNLLGLLLIKSKFPNTKIENYISDIFTILDLKTIEKINQQNVLSNYFSELHNLNCLDYENINKDILKEFILNNAVEFKNLKFNENHIALLNFIYDNNLYELNPNMIELFLKMKGKFDFKKFETSNYTTIINSGCDTLIDYVNEYIDKYIEKTFLKLENNNNESQESLKLLLENENLSEEYFNELVINGKFIINDLTIFHSREIQASLISNNKIETNWENIISYYKNEKQIDDIIINYLNISKNYEVLSKLGLIKDSDESIKTNFSMNLIKSEISNESFSKIANNLPFSYEDGEEFIEINESKMKSLIETKRIILSTDNYSMINENFDDLVMLLIEKNINEFIETIEEYLLDDSIVLDVLNSKSITSSQKISVIEFIDDSIMLENKNLLVKLAEFLLTNKINKISSSLLAELISNSTSLKSKVELTNKYFSHVETNNLRKIIVKIGEPYSNLLLGKHPKVDNTSYNQELIKNLIPKLISKSKPTKDNKKIELFPYAIPKI